MVTRGIQRIKAWVNSMKRRRSARMVKAAMADGGNVTQISRRPSRMSVMVQRVRDVLARPRSRVWLRSVTFVLLVAATYGLWQGSRITRILNEPLTLPPTPNFVGEAPPAIQPLGQVADLGPRISSTLFDVPLPPLIMPDVVMPNVGGRSEGTEAPIIEPVSVVPSLPDILDLAQVVWPVTGGVQGEYGWHRDPVTNDWRFRSGVMIEPEREHAPVRAALPGRVESINTSGNGYRVVVSHAEGWSTEYVGLSSLDATAGQRVGAGDRIGEIDLAPHRSGLYFVMRDASGPVNPLGILYTPPSK